MTAHTPGPWREVDWKGEPLIIHDHADSGNFDLIVTGPFSPANARLIAAAPDLLAVAKRIALWPARKRPAMLALQEAARSAIAKAEDKL